MSMTDSIAARRTTITVADVDADTPEQLLDLLEHRVEDGNTRLEEALNDWADSAGAALLRIQEESLWRLRGHITWMDYLRERFPRYVSEAYREMDVVKAQRALAAGGMTLDKESHAQVVMKVVRSKGTEAARNLYARAAESTDGRKRTAAKLQALAVEMGLVEQPPGASRNQRTDQGEPVYNVTSIADTSTTQTPPTPLFSAPDTTRPVPPAGPSPAANPFTIVPASPDDGPVMEPEPVVIAKLRLALNLSAELTAVIDDAETAARVEHPDGSRELIDQIIANAGHVLEVLSFSQR